MASTRGRVIRVLAEENRLTPTGCYRVFGSPKSDHRLTRTACNISLMVRVAVTNK